MQKHIALFDTSIASLNVGDSIIMDAVNLEVQDIFPFSQYIKIPTHEKIGLTSLSIVRKSEYAIVGGSNILSSYMNKYKQWKLDVVDNYFLKERVTLLGVGWRDYQGSANLYTKFFLRRVLNKDVVHSVRDSYTENRLRELKIDNVINTGCPTMWRLTPDHCAKIPVKKSNSVIFTLTDYNPNVELDRRLIVSLQKNYPNVYFWVQGYKDLTYFHSFGTLINNVKIIAPNIAAYNAILNNNEIDYVGTRLHGGIRALQKAKRSLIIGIDNRAKEKKIDFNLPVLEREKIEDLDNWINSIAEVKIHLPQSNIDRWKNQFKTQRLA